MKSIDHNSLLPQNDKRRNHFRKGAVVIIPLVCLILTLAIIGELLKQTSIELNQLKKSQHNLQAIWLSEAAVQRTVNRLTEDLTQEIGGPYPGEVVIEIDRALIQDQSMILIRTKASYPAKAIERVRVIREWPVQLSNTAIENNSPSQ